MRPGRPVGSTDTPAVVLRRSMQDSARLAQRARRILEKRLESIEESTSINSDEVIAIHAELNKTAIEAGKLLVPKGKGDESSSGDATPERIMSELTKGKQSK